MQLTTSYRIRVSSKHPHVASRIRALLSSSAHNEKALSDSEYELFECSDEVVFLSVSKYDQLQTMIEYEADNNPTAHGNFVSALKCFPDTGVRIMDEQVVG